jgi:hypothetical protein
MTSAAATKYRAMKVFASGVRRTFALDASGYQQHVNE